jgi:lipopolysaccharide/colanic/teichoic acid biosynthesis glycosyltransferase
VSGRRLVGLSSGTTRLEDVVTTRDVDTVVLAFQHVSRGEFFSALDTCHRHGVTVKILRERSDTVLTDDEVNGPLVDVRVEPWDPQDYVFKRLFDIVFAATGLLLTAPLSVVIAVAIKLDSDGPVLFKQPRTTRLGQTFTFYKFRTMVENAEEMTGVTISQEDAGGEDPRVTRVGRVLRRTYLDEIPQLLLILTGEMSVVGPRPAQTEIEHEFQTDHPEWVKRWSVKPGLTGLAQVNDATGLNPAEKLRYDLLYIKRQSLSYDLKLVVRQIRKVFDGLLGR